MLTDLADHFRPVAPPRIIEDVYTDDQHARLMEVVRSHGPWPLILAENFEHPEEVIATERRWPQPAGIYWDELPPEKLAAIPVLRQLRPQPPDEKGRP